ncbi:MAG: polysaccharide deacetylase family protein, partial [Alphaproteobacteria bacterium]|nr:polysaccharide deacetylase family protein [Alphaproteobacteria bacterium]
MMDSLLNGILKVLSRGRVTIFAFHKVPLEKDPLRPDELNLSEFVRLLDVIQSCFDIVPLSHALQNVQNNTSVRRMGCLTFDDGYSDWMDGVVPLLRERNLHATFFIATQQLIGNAIWNERIRHAVQCMPSSELGRSLAEAELASASEMADRIRILSYFE